jgi:Ca2+-binding EF-hand superfamily protein
MGGNQSAENGVNNLKEEEQDKAKLAEQLEHDKLVFGEFDDLFDKYDHDCDGFLDEFEVQDALKSYVMKHKDQKHLIDDLTNQLEISADYKLNKEDFRNMMVSFVGRKDPIDEIIDVFKVFDKNLSAQIGATELSHVFRKLGLTLTDEESTSLVKEGDNDNDAVVDFHEFISIMISK